MAKEKKAKGKELTFVYEYAKSWVGSDAYRIAFPDSNPVHAKQYAYKLLKKPYIQEAINKAVEDAIGPMEKDLRENIEFWVKIRDDESKRDSDRLKASENLAKYRGFFTEKHEHSGEVAVNIVDDI